MNDLNAVDPDWAWQPFLPTEESPWDVPAAAHLYRRAGFGADLATLDAAVAKEPAVVVDELVSRNTETTDFRSTADALAETVLASGDAKKLSAAWVYRLLFTPSQLLEKTTLFWHGHFATSAAKVQDARMMWNQNQRLRDEALGDFSRLVQGIAKDPAMLIYLDSAINRKAHPNENFARELMELFCLGEGNYTERDVLELARCFTGWEIRNKKFRKNRYQQDTGIKSVLGRQAAFDGEDAVEVVLDQPHVEQFLVRKWFRYFVADQPEPSEQLLRPLVSTFRDHDLQIVPVLRRMLGSNLFFSPHAIGHRIKSPVELIVGTLRSLRATTNTQLVAEGLMKIGQGLFYPPNVKGWDGGRAWINSSTLLGRSNLMARVLEDPSTRFAGKTLKDYLHDCSARDTDEVMDHFARTMIAIPLPESTRQQLKDAFSSNDQDEERALRSLLHAVLSLPQSQLG